MEELRSCSGQLDRERQAVEAPAHVGNRARVLVVQLEGGIGRACSRDEERNSLVGGELLERGVPCRRRKRQRRNRIRMLAGEPKR